MQWAQTATKHPELYVVSLHSRSIRSSMDLVQKFICIIIANAGCRTMMLSAGRAAQNTLLPLTQQKQLQVMVTLVQGTLRRASPSMDIMTTE